MEGGRSGRKKGGKTYEENGPKTKKVPTWHLPIIMVKGTSDKLPGKRGENKEKFIFRTKLIL